MVEAEEWTRIASADRGIQPAELWKNCYSGWGDAARDRASATATAHFASSSTEFTTRRRELLESEQRELAAWLRQRMLEITNKAEETSTQRELFHESAAVPQAAPVWRTLMDPMERLAGFETDRAQPTKLRNEARGVLELYERRRKDLVSRLALVAPMVVPLGILMLIPEVVDAA